MDAAPRLPRFSVAPTRRHSVKPVIAGYTGLTNWPASTGVSLSSILPLSPPPLLSHLLSVTFARLVSCSIYLTNFSYHQLIDLIVGIYCIPSSLFVTCICNTNQLNEKSNYISLSVLFLRRRSEDSCSVKKIEPSYAEIVTCQFTRRAI